MAFALLALHIYLELRECSPLLGHPRGGAKLCQLVANVRFQATNQLPLLARSNLKISRAVPTTFEVEEKRPIALGDGIDLILDVVGEIRLHKILAEGKPSEEGACRSRR